jgi:DNA-3-methyladenine glycosylase
VASSSSRSPLSQDFYARDTVTVARDLLGAILQTRIRGATTSGRIVEVEAYVGPHDPAAHGFGNRRSARNDRLFGPPGTAYVYFTYGMHWCFNAVTEREGYPSAVLIRSLEPLSGIDTMRRRRAAADVGVLCAGPARLCQALGITGAMNGAPLDSGRVRILDGTRRRRHIVVTRRIGISKAIEWPLRFHLRGSRWLSRREKEAGREKGQG